MISNLIGLILIIYFVIEPSTILIQRGSIQLRNYVIGFSVVYKVFSVYYTIGKSENSNGKKEDFDYKSDLSKSNFFLNIETLV